MRAAEMPNKAGFPEIGDGMTTENVYTLKHLHEEDYNQLVFWRERVYKCIDWTLDGLAQESDELGFTISRALQESYNHFADELRRNFDEELYEMLVATIDSYPLGEEGGKVIGGGTE